MALNQVHSHLHQSLTSPTRVTSPPLVLSAKTTPGLTCIDGRFISHPVWQLVISIRRARGVPGVHVSPLPLLQFLALFDLLQEHLADTAGDFVQFGLLSL